MLKWTSESEYFLSFEKKFADTIHELYNPVQEQSLNPFAAHARGRVTRVYIKHKGPCKKGDMCKINLKAASQLRHECFSIVLNQ